MELPRQLLLQVQQLVLLPIPHRCRFFTMRYIVSGTVRKFIDRNNDRNTKLDRVLNVFCHVDAPSLNEINILGAIDIRNGQSGSNLNVNDYSQEDPYFWSSSMHLQRLNSRNQDNAIRYQRTGSAFYVECFLHSAIRAKSGLCNNVARMLTAHLTGFSASQFQSNFVRDNGRVSMGNIRKGARVNENWSSLYVSV